MSIHIIAMYFNLYENFFSTLNRFFVIILIVVNNGVTGVIHGKYTENIKQYHLAVPHKATPEGEFSSFHLTHFHDFDPKEFMKRRKREIDDPDAVHYGISVENEVHHVELWPNRDFLHPQALIERRDPTLPVHKRDVRSFKNKKMCYYIGKVRGDDNSRAALSTCDGLTGYIHVGKKMYFIEPVHAHTPNSKGHHLHVVYSADAEPAENFCGVKNSEENWKNTIKSRLREEYLNGKDLLKRDVSNFEVVPQWMETMLVCDKKMVMKHKGKRDIEQWVLTVFSVVKSYYSDGSMTGVLQPVLVRIVLLEKEEEEMDLDIIENCEKTLDSFCKWVKKLQPKDPTHPNHFDVAVLLSDWDFCDKKGNCGTQGLAYLNGACTKDRNCQLNEDKGLVTTVIVSHEQGHLLGMEHDEIPPIPCPAEDPTDNSWYVMSPIGHIYTLRWSPCSTASMRQLAQAHLLDCFNDEPTNDEYPLSDPMPGVIYGLDEQCDMTFRDDNTVMGACRKDKGVNCTLMFCERDIGCRGYPLELADGTPCGDNKWCFKTKCEDKGTRPTAVDGGWGEWGDWTKCTKSCGRGVQFKERLCDNPKPENHGSYCIGAAKTFRVCNSQDCPPDTPPFRAQQCEELFPKSYQALHGYVNAKDYGSPYYNPKNPCQLDCKTKNDRVYTIANTIADGAKCEIGNPLKMCLNSHCVEVGCDGKFEGSEAVEDRCGICNGDGTLCKLVEGTDSTAFRGYRMVAVVPTGAKKVKIEKSEPSSNFLALGLPDSKTVEFNANLIRTKTGIFPLGTKHRSFFLYTRTPATPREDTESIIWDTTREDIGVYIAHRSKAIKKPVKWSWIEALDNPSREPQFRWQIADYKECSAKCGGGLQEPILNCYEEVSGKVADTFCEKLERPKEEPIKCNEKPCEPEWKVSEWGKCRACKMKGGVRIREVECVKKNPRPGGDDILVEDSECKDEKPGAIQLCETREKCGTRKRKAPYVPAKFQDTVWRQMNKLHLKKRGVVKQHVYLKGKAPTSTKRTTAFTWTPPALKDPTGVHVVIDDEFPDQRGDVIKMEMKVITLNDTEGDFGGSKTVIVPGATVKVKGETLPKKYSKEGKGKKHEASTSKPKHTTEK